jgi:crotonobetainyl-CoA:carnitine CoA-transferase CaiB-like acyl-CoA transferase
MGAVMAQLRDGEGQHVDVSIQESLASQQELFFEYWPYMGIIASRLGRKPIQPVESLQCKDGWIYVCCIEEHQWRAFVEVMGNPEWAQEEIFADRVKRGENWEALKIFLDEYVSQQTVLELYKKVQEKRVPFAPVSTMGDLLNSEHLKARGFFVEIAHPVAGKQIYPGAPLKYGATPWEIRLPAPTLGQHNDEIFGKRLGLKANRLTELKRMGVI